MAEVSMKFNLDDLALMLAENVDSSEELMEFILGVDSYVADWDFTIKLHRKLSELLVQAELPDVGGPYVLEFGDDGTFRSSKPSEGALAFFDFFTKPNKGDA